MVIKKPLPVNGPMTDSKGFIAKNSAGPQKPGGWYLVSGFRRFLGFLSRPGKLRDILVLLLVIALAGIPPYLVMANRWFETLESDVLNPLWCESLFLCGSWLPSYFLVVFICLGLLLVLIFFLRKNPVVIQENPLESLRIAPVGKKQTRAGLIYIYAAVAAFIILVVYSLFNIKLPGWNLAFIWLLFMLGCFLYNIPLDLVINLWRRNGNLYIAQLLFQTSIVAFLWGLYQNPDILWLTVGLTILAAANLWRFRRDIPPIYWIVTLALVVFTINLNGWWTVAVGDDYDFLYFARAILSITRFQDVGNLLFKGTAAHGSHPFFSSFLQSISMMVLGNNNFGWRFSNPFLCAVSVIFFYLFCRTFISKRLSLMAAFLMAVSSCLMSFSKIGYNNLQALFAMTLLLATAAWALRAGNLLTYACLGSEIAFCFYIYPAALYVIPLPFLLLVLYDFPKTRRKFGLWLVMILTAIALIFPLFMQASYWNAKLPGTFYNQPELVQSTSAMTYHVVTNLLYAFFSYMFIVQESHFIASSYLDPLTCGFFVIGFCLLICQMKRQKFPLFILLSYIFFLLIIGVSHDRTHPPNTRMFLFIPLYALIAAWGVSWIAGWVGKIKPLTGRFYLIIACLFTILMTGINLYQAYPLSHFRFTNLQSFESLFVRVAKRVSRVKPNFTRTFAVIVDQDWGIDGLLMLQEVYPELAYVKIEQIRIETPPVPDDYKKMLQDPDTVVFFFAKMDPSWFQPLGDQLKGYGKVPCEITTYTGASRFTLYHDPNLPQACYP
jgi:hypothetical protein